VFSDTIPRAFVASCMLTDGAKGSSAESIAKTDQPTLLSIFSNEKLAKQILSAAKRVSNPKKRPAGSIAASLPSAKRSRGSSANGEHGSDRDIEIELALPTTEAQEHELLRTTLQTNRAPLVLAFAVTLLKYTMPEQPLSSRLSLAQAVVSANSQSKARSIGLETGKTAEEEGWAKGQPKITLLGREIAVMRRGDYSTGEAANEGDSQAISHNHTAFWGLDIEALRKSNGPLVAGKSATAHSRLPIHTPEAARNYLLKAFTAVEREDGDDETEIKSDSSPARKKPTLAQLIAKKEEAAARLLKALDRLFESWASKLDKADLDRRAWGWYLHVRPDVAQGQAGWGQRGQVKLESILKLRRGV
jgi:hypothetical protein